MQPASLGVDRGEAIPTKHCFGQEGGHGRVHPLQRPGGDVVCPVVRGRVRVGVTAQDASRCLHRAVETQEGRKVDEVTRVLGRI